MIGEVGLLRLDGRDQGRRVAGLGDHLVAGVVEQPRQPLAEQGRVLADHDAHGSAASTVVPSPGGLATLQRAAERGHPVGQARAERPSSGAAAAVVGDPDHDVAVDARDAQLDPGRLGVLDRVGHGLADHEVRRGGHVVGQRTGVARPSRP